MPKHCSCGGRRCELCSGDHEFLTEIDGQRSVPSVYSMLRPPRSVLVSERTISYFTRLDHIQRVTTVKSLTRLACTAEPRARACVTGVSQGQGFRHVSDA
jgi:hypothetical protein